MKKKVLLVGPIPPPFGGIPKYVNDLLKSKYLNANFSLNLFNTAIPEKVRSFKKDNQRSYFSFLAEGWVPAMSLVFYTLHNIFFSYTKTLIKVNPEIIHIFTCSYWGFWRNCLHVLMGRLLRKKVYFHLLNAIDKFWDDSSFFGRKFISFFLNISDCLIVQSDGIKHFVEKISSTKVVSIYNGVDVDLYNTDKLSRIVDKDIFFFFFVGSICKNKGVYDIIQSLKHIKNNIKIIMIGACDQDYFNKYIKEQRVSNIVFKGSISESEKINILKNSDLFILPSYAEGQPLSILEAMASGLPIISTTVGSIPEIIKNGVNGFLIEPGDIIGIAKHIDYLASNKKIMNKISINNSRIAIKRYNVNRMIKQISFLYK